MVVVVTLRVVVEVGPAAVLVVRVVVVVVEEVGPAPGKHWE